MKTRNEVQNQLRDNNLSPTKMANELQVNTNAIYFVLSGKMTSKRIQEYLEKTPLAVLAYPNVPKQSADYYVTEASETYTDASCGGPVENLKIGFCRESMS